MITGELKSQVDKIWEAFGQVEFLTLICHRTVYLSPFCKKIG